MELKFTKQMRGLSIVIPAKAGIQKLLISWIPGRASYASLPGMTADLFHGLRKQALASASRIFEEHSRPTIKGL